MLLLLLVSLSLTFSSSIINFHFYLIHFFSQTLVWQPLAENNFGLQKNNVVPCTDDYYVYARLPCCLLPVVRYTHHTAMLSIQCTHTNTNTHERCRYSKFCDNKYFLNKINKRGVLSVFNLFLRSYSFRHSFTLCHVWPNETEGLNFESSIPVTRYAKFINKPFYAFATER